MTPPKTDIETLQHLLLRIRDERDLTWPEMARLCRMRSHTTLYALATKPTHHTPARPETIEKISRGLGLPLIDVRRAAARSAGLI